MPIVTIVAIGFFVGLKVSFGGCEGVGNFVMCNRKIIFIWKR